MRCAIRHPRTALALALVSAVCLLFADGADAHGHMRDTTAVRAVTQWHAQHGYEMGEPRNVRHGMHGDNWTLVDVRYFMGTDDSGPIDVDEYLVDVFYVRPAGHGVVELKEPDTWPRIWRFKIAATRTPLDGLTPLDKLMHRMGTANRKAHR